MSAIMEQGLVVKFHVEETRRKNEVFGYACDHFKKFVYQNCSDLRTTKIQIILLSEGVVFFYC